jgi:hypothetical protein
MLGVPPRLIAGRAGYWLRVVLVVVAVAHRRLGPSSSATTSTTERVLASSRRDGLGWSARTVGAAIVSFSTVRPDPSTLSVAGEQGSRHEGRLPARLRR